MDEKITKMIKRVKRELGYPLIDIELDDDAIQEIVEDSIEDLNPYAGHYKAQTVNLTNGYADLTTYEDIFEVVGIISAESDTTITNDGLSDIAVDCLGYMTNSNSPYTKFTDRLLLQAARKKLISSFTEDTNFKVVNDILYVSPTYSQITIEYRPKWTTDDISSMTNEMYTMLSRYVLDKCKITIGRARKKYSSNNAVFNLDVDILEEGQSDLDELLKNLNENQLILPEFL